jgi:hypothetical protein
MKFAPNPPESHCQTSAKSGLGRGINISFVMLLAKGIQELQKEGYIRRTEFKKGITK